VNSLVNNDCLGYELPRIFMYNSSVNGYSDITFRKKSLVLETLSNLANIYINNSLCKEIQSHFNLDVLPEDILYSYYIFNIRNKNSHVDENVSLANNAKSISALTKNIAIVNYKFNNLEMCSLKQYITEFINLRYKY
jgi:hypothetical protein